MVVLDNRGVSIRTLAKGCRHRTMGTLELQFLMRGRDTVLGKACGDATSKDAEGQSAMIHQEYLDFLTVWGEHFASVMIEDAGANDVTPMMPRNTRARARGPNPGPTAANPRGLPIRSRAGRGCVMRARGPRRRYPANLAIVARADEVKR